MKKWKKLHTSEKTDTGDENGANMVPAEWRLVDLGESKTTTLVRVGDMGVVVVEVVKGSIASFGSGRHFENFDSVECSLSVVSVKERERRNASTRLTLGKGLGKETKNQAHGVWQVFNIDSNTRETGDASTTALDRG
jgi:hypothetical protein